MLMTPNAHANYRALEFIKSNYLLLADKYFDGVYDACAHTGEIHFDKFFPSISAFFEALPGAEVCDVRMVLDPNTDVYTLVIYS